MNIYIPNEVHEKIMACSNELGRQIEQYVSSSTLAKYRGIDLLHQSILVKFTNKSPAFVMYNDMIYGKASLTRQNENDVAYPIHRSGAFNEYNQKTFEFFLSIGDADNGIMGGKFARVLGISGNEYDFTDYSTW